MRKLIMWNVITLDGYFEGEKSWDLSFHDLIWGDEVEQFGIEQLDSADMLVFGRVTYEGMAAYWQAAEGETAKRMNAMQKVVCTRSLNAADWNNTVIIRDAAVEIADIKRQGNGNMFVFGSGDLSASLMKEKLFDEYRLLVAPVFLGKGRLLFGDGLPYQKLKRLEVLPLTNGGVIMRYVPLEGASS